MCGSHGFNGSCCPHPQILKEKICGNFIGSAGATPILWQAPEGDYIEGTFQVFNSAASGGNASGNISLAGGIGIGMSDATPGNTISQSVPSPVSFSIIAPVGVSGTYCITLYKRVLL
ncbi:hypothetical protein Q8G31_30300 [Priestia megaterium]|uniref:S-Ena type endospore appendage n=1 Tax=Priestia megaterium TaxID=1404 RepID=UPI002730E865|nr:S-Ena type endospore appendage [Priestia megaterium]MDP1383939.1 hypothetical protein [Priestia megaterium]MDP1428091.1 hypothetical protein [Priestia megaterium]